MSDLFHEISEELKQENLHRMYAKYSGIVFTAIFLIIAGTAGFVGWEHYVETKRTESSRRYFEAVDAGSIEQLDALTKEQDNGFAVLAGFKKAEILINNDEKESARLVYRELADEFPENKAISDVANLFSAYQLAQNGKQQAKQKLAIINTPSSPFYSSARELLGLIALDEGDHETANKIFDELANDALTPPSMKTRLKKLMRNS